MLVAALSLLFFGLVECGINVPRDNCEWKGGHYGALPKCDGDQIAVGMCGSGGKEDCEGGFVSLIKCCQFPGFYNGHCEIYSGMFGEPISCVKKSGSGNLHLVEAVCASGGKADCDGYSHQVQCCDGHMADKFIGTNGECDWKYTAAWGGKLECGRSDETVMGWCGSGEHKDCPGDAVHGILCCVLTEL